MVRTRNALPCSTAAAPEMKDEFCGLAAFEIDRQEALGRCSSYDDPRHARPKRFTDPAGAAPRIQLSIMKLRRLGAGSRKSGVVRRRMLLKARRRHRLQPQSTAPSSTESTCSTSACGSSTVELTCKPEGSSTLDTASNLYETFKEEPPQACSSTTASFSPATWSWARWSTTKPPLLQRASAGAAHLPAGQRPGDRACRTRRCWT